MQKAYKSQGARPFVGITKEQGWEKGKISPKVLVKEHMGKGKKEGNKKVGIPLHKVGSEEKLLRKGLKGKA